jgi:uncharacterized membrane protein YhaH (DUF805 family)
MSNPQMNMPPVAPGPQLPLGDRGIDQPWYGIGFGAALSRFFKKLMVGKGRASRGEFWWAVLGVFIIEFILGIISNRTGGAVSTVIGIINFILELGLIPIAIRRLHDTNKSAAWIVLWFIAIICQFVMTITALFSPFLAAILGVVFAILTLICMIWFIVIMASKTYMGTTQWDIPIQQMPQQPMQ